MIKPVAAPLSTQPLMPANLSESGLLLDLDNVPPYRLLRFVTLGRQVCPGF
jgi:hypothetical protein